MISDNLLRDSSGLQFMSEFAGIKNKYWMQQHGNMYEGFPLRTFGGPNYLADYSDHFPVFVRISSHSKGVSN
ncbi:MAG: hypothetical protein ACI9GO_000727 [Bacteroidia bacterium]|jgi:hypothetical protein